MDRGGGALGCVWGWALLFLSCIRHWTWTHSKPSHQTQTHRIPLRGLEFPYAFELTADNLLFPLTKDAWEKDTRCVASLLASDLAVVG